MTKFYKIDPDNIDQSIIEEAADYLRNGKLVAFPTETVYGIGANALDATAVEKIFAVKKRPSSDPLIVHIHALSHIDDVVSELPGLAIRLAERFWPGPLTLILKKSDQIPANVTSGAPSVAVRIPSHPVAQRLLATANIPVAAPSANLFSRPSSTSGKHVSEDFASGLDMVLDGGESSIGVESTVISLIEAVPTILRPGGLSLEDLQAVIPEVQLRTSYLAEDAEVSSPGMLLKHYSPNARLVLFLGDDENRVLDRLASEAEQLEASGQTVGILGTSNQTAQLDNRNRVVFELGNQGDLEAISRSLYKGLRSLDEQQVDVILASAPQSTGLGLAIRDRLYRAAEGNVIQIT